MTVSITSRFDPSETTRGLREVEQVAQRAGKSLDDMGRQGKGAAQAITGMGQMAKLARDAMAQMDQTVQSSRKSLGDWSDHLIADTRRLSAWRAEIQQSQAALVKLRAEHQAAKRESASSFGAGGGSMGLSPDQWQRQMARRDAVYSARGQVDPKGAAFAGAGAGVVEGAIFDRTGSALLSGAAGAALSNLSPEMTRLAGSLAKASIAGAAAYATFQSISSILSDLADPNHTRSAIGRSFASSWAGGSHGGTLAAEDADVKRWSSARQASRIRTDPNDRSLEAMNQMAGLRTARGNDAWEANLARGLAGTHTSGEASRNAEDLLKIQERLASEGKLEGERADRIEKEILAYKQLAAQLDEKERTEAKQWEVDRTNAWKAELAAKQEAREKARQERAEERRAQAEAAAQRMQERLDMAKERQDANVARGQAVQTGGGAAGAGGFDAVAAIMGQIPEGQLERRQGQRRGQTKREAREWRSKDAEEKRQGALDALEQKYAGTHGAYIDTQTGAWAEAKRPKEYYRERASIMRASDREERAANRRDSKAIDAGAAESDSDVQYEMANELVTGAVKAGAIDSNMAQALRGLLAQAQKAQQQMDQLEQDTESIKQAVDSLAKPQAARRKHQVAGLN